MSLGLCSFLCYLGLPAIPLPPRSLSTDLSEACQSSSFEPKTVVYGGGMLSALSTTAWAVVAGCSHWDLNAALAFLVRKTFDPSPPTHHLKNEFCWLRCGSDYYDYSENVFVYSFYFIFEQSWCPIIVVVLWHSWRLASFSTVSLGWVCQRLEKLPTPLCSSHPHPAQPMLMILKWIMVMASKLLYFFLCVSHFSLVCLPLQSCVSPTSVLWLSLQALCLFCPMFLTFSLCVSCASVVCVSHFSLVAVTSGVVSLLSHVSHISVVCVLCFSRVCLPLQSCGLQLQSCVCHFRRCVSSVPCFSHTRCVCLVLQSCVSPTSVLQSPALVLRLSLESLAPLLSRVSHTSVVCVSCASVLCASRFSRVCCVLLVSVTCHSDSFSPACMHAVALIPFHWQFSSWRLWCLAVYRYWCISAFICAQTLTHCLCT